MNIEALCAELLKSGDQFTVDQIRAAAERVDAAKTAPQGKSDGAPKKPVKTSLDASSEAE